MNTMSLQAQSVIVSSQSTSTAVFIPMTEWIPAGEVAKARYTLEMRGNSQYCAIAGGYQTSQDRISVDAAAQIGSASYLSADGYDYPTAFTDLSSTMAGKAYVRFGILAKLSSGSNAQGCWASIRVDIQGP